MGDQPGQGIQIYGLTTIEPLESALGTIRPRDSSEMKTFGFKFVIVFAICLSAITAACTKTSQPVQKFGGRWTLSLGRRTFMVLTLKENGNSVSGTLSLPEHFQVDSSGFHFSKIAPDVRDEPITNATIKDNHLHFVTANPKDKNDTNEMDMTIVGTDQANLKFADAPFDPWPVSRIPVNALAAVSMDWDVQGVYTREDNVASNTEMQHIFEEDQRPRQNPAELTPERWVVLNKEDAERQRQTRQFLSEGKLHTGEDFSRAAFIFQHGSTPDDYLLAHTLAMVAVAKGTGDAIWIASATLDRYLHSTGKSQIYGTQFKAGSATQEPFNRDLVSDSLRQQLGVPSLANQQDQRKFWEEQMKTAAGKSQK
jgi:hypothetical protein